jgi:ATP/maltotriose-dependent transcriptional regulator MalT
MALAAWQGREHLASELIGSSTSDAERGEGVWLTALQWATAVLYNGLGRYQDALDAAEQASERPDELPFAACGLVELIEAASRTGKVSGAADALERLAQSTRASGTDWALGIEARAGALLTEGEAAERLYREAIDRLGHARVRGALARAHLLYGEWLRRERRRLDAREQLRIAHEMLLTMGMQAFAERAERELLATGETARKRAVETSSQLTPQEAQVARLARDGLSNPEIGAHLFISASTVDYHLHKVYRKLGISSRMQLHRVLPGEPNAL